MKASTMNPDLGPYCLQYTEATKGQKQVAQLSGRVLDSRMSGSEFEPHRRHCIEFMSKTH